ncbi:nitroreductase [Pseudonocardia sp. N23]|uniref:Acg family FMN-binding oxidoreductase n=1 Tax=Pseudonocardia sp. N23 TaxID=1987376 RepID=UPI001C0F3742|nr:nitroreductase [Pseudonocardia sp. N23]
MSETAHALGTTRTQLLDVIHVAGLAPSLHNTQPWRFHVTPDRLELWADRSRQLHVADPDGRELRIACGAALFNLRLALLGVGVRPLVSVVPDPDRPDLIAVVRRGGTRPASPQVKELLRAVPLRRTNRRPFADAEVATSARYELRRAAIEEGAWLDLVTDPDIRVELSGLAREAHDLQVSDPEFVAELDAWTGHVAERRDGVPARSGGPLPPPNSTWVFRDFTKGSGATGRIYEAEPLIGVLSVHGDGPRQDVRAGEALERVLLTATVHGLAASFLSQLVEVPGARDRVRQLTSGTRPPQVVMRIGHGWPVAATPRRPLDEILVEDRPQDRGSTERRSAELDPDAAQPPGPQREHPRRGSAGPHPMQPTP